MLFNSVEFLFFFLVVTVIYFLLPLRLRWLHLLVSSCIFYMAFIPVYIFILFFTIIIDYIAGILIENAQVRKRRMFLIISLCANIGVLAVFKYYDFFTENINLIIDSLGMRRYELPYFHIILPVGLSFHTFQAMSYTIEVFRGNQKAERHLGIYSLYVMFYPQLVAGPIERPQNLLHQFREKYDLDYDRMRSGFLLMLWGFFQKVVIADRLGLYVDPVFNHPDDFSGLSVIIASFFFAFQIYSDFAGYTDIARGAARFMGFRLMKNFDSPFMSRNVTEFWRRWHISLSSWFNDYVFKPFVIGYRDWGNRAVIIGLLLTFTLSGLWHGAGWTFIVFGTLQGGALVYEFKTKKMRGRISKATPAFLYNTSSQILTLCFMVFTWIFFRSASFHDAIQLISNAFDFTQANSFRIGFFKKDVYDISRFDIMVSPLLIILLMVYNMLHLRIRKMGTKLFEQRAYLRWSVYYLLLLGIMELGVFSKSTFIYFQF